MSLLDLFSKVMQPHIFNYIIMTLYVINACWWAFGQNHYGQASYWISAFAITASVTWGMK